MLNSLHNLCTGKTKTKPFKKYNYGTDYQLSTP